MAYFNGYNNTNPYTAPQTTTFPASQTYPYAPAVPPYNYNTQQYPNQIQPNTGVLPPVTNKKLCVSKDDALVRQVEYNSDYVYFDQNKDLLYNVKTDAFGNKSCDVYTLAKYKETEVKTEAAPVQNESYKDLSDRIAQLEEKLNSMEVKVNGKHDGERNASTSKPANESNDANDSASKK